MHCIDSNSSKEKIDIGGNTLKVLEHSKKDIRNIEFARWPETVY